MRPLQIEDSTDGSLIEDSIDGSLAVEFLHNSLTCFLAAEEIYQQDAELARLVRESPFGNEVNSFVPELRLLDNSSRSDDVIQYTNNDAEHQEGRASLLDTANLERKIGYTLENVIEPNSDKRGNIRESKPIRERIETFVWDKVVDVPWWQKFAYVCVVLLIVGTTIGLIADFNGRDKLPEKPLVHIGVHQKISFHVAHEKKSEVPIAEAIPLNKPVKISSSFSENTITGSTGITIKSISSKTEQASESIELLVHVYDKQGNALTEDKIARVTWKVEPPDFGEVNPEEGYEVTYQATKVGSVDLIATVHLKNTPPIASFIVTPTSGDTNTLFAVDASGSSDQEDKTSNLQVRWDWENDGVYDIELPADKKATHQYSTDGRKTIKMEVKDTGGLTSTKTMTVTVTLINTPPTAFFTVTPTSGDTNEVFTVDASGSSDQEDTTSSLQVRWDWEDDGVYDIELPADKKTTHQYLTDGPKTIRMEVKDTGGLTRTKTMIVAVEEELTNKQLALKYMKLVLGEPLSLRIPNDWQEHVVARDENQRSFLELSVHYWTKAVKQHPGEVENYIYNGFLHFVLGDYEQAVSFFERARNIEKTDTLILNLAMANLAAGNPAESLRELESRMQVSDAHKEEICPYLYRVALSLESQKIYEEAVHALKLAKDFTPATEHLKTKYLKGDLLVTASPSPTYVNQTVNLSAQAENKFGYPISQVKQWLGDKWEVKVEESKIEGLELGTPLPATFVPNREGIFIITTSDGLNEGQITIPVYHPASVAVYIETIVSGKPGMIHPDIQALLERDLESQGYHLKTPPDEFRPEFHQAIEAQKKHTLETIYPQNQELFRRMNDKLLPAIIVVGKVIVEVTPYQPEIPSEGDAKVKAGWKTAEAQLGIRVLETASWRQYRYTASGSRDFPEKDAIEWALEEAYNSMKEDLFRKLNELQRQNLPEEQ